MLMDGEVMTKSELDSLMEGMNRFMNTKFYVETSLDEQSFFEDAKNQIWNAIKTNEDLEFDDSNEEGPKMICYK